MQQFPHSIPIELMEILNRINDNINEVKERIARIEAQDHSDSIRSIRTEIKQERDERIKLQIELANVKTRLAPIIMGISVAGAAIIQLIIQTFHN
jgi:chromosome segregation ATPase